MLFIESAIVRVDILALLRFFSLHLDSMGLVLELDPHLTVAVEKFISQSFDLLNVATIHQNPSKSPTDTTSSAS